MIVPKVPHLLYGGDYNPEQWPEEVWLEDARLMQEAGVNLVSVGIFSWALLEPIPGTYDFGWLDRVLDILHDHGVAADLATATASPPPWLTTLQPEILPVDEYGHRLSPGSRAHYCPSSPHWRESASRLVHAIAEHYREHPALAMWHVGNEYGRICYCDISAAAFRRWLIARYGTLDELNRAWGTAFWSQRYTDWEQILPPRVAPTFINPTQQLDYRRFSSDTLLECYEMERAILRKLTPDIPITTNFMSFFKPLDYWTWAAREDIVTLDSYPEPEDPNAIVDAAANCDLMRSLGGGRPWLLLEQTTGQVNWRSHNPLKRPGQMRLWSYEAIARGSDGAMFFQWRQSQAGAEKFHSAMVPHVGTDSRIWREVVQLGNELKGLDAIAGTGIDAGVAILFDWESWWALEADAKPSADLRFLDQVRAYYEPLYGRNIAVDFVHPGADLSAYRLLLAPNLYLVRAEHAAAIERFVESGGTLVMSFFSGIVDPDEHVYLGGYGAPFRRTLGIHVAEMDPFMPGVERTLQDHGGASWRCSLWSDVIDLEGAQPIATYTDGPHAGRPAVTRHDFGAGRALYLGTRPEPAAMAHLLEVACAESTVEPVADVPAGIEASRRSGEQGRFLFLLNHSREQARVVLPGAGTDLLTGERLEGSVELAPMGVVIVQEDR